MELHSYFLLVGGLLLASLLADELGHRMHIPRVTLLILLGLVIGKSGFDVLPDGFVVWNEAIASIGLTMIAFLLGGQLSYDTVRRHGKAILVISLCVVTMTATIVGVGLLVLGVAAPLALLLAAIATATAPANVQDVVRQTGAAGPFTKSLLGIVAIDDAWGLVMFSMMFVAASMISGNGYSNSIEHGVWEIFSAVMVGCLIGFPAAYLTGRVRKGEPLQSEAIGSVFLCAGLSIWVGGSFLLAGMVAGAIIVNFAKHHERAFHEIENIEWPFMVLFFVLAGATLHMDNLAVIGPIVVAYIILRTVSRLAAGWIGGGIANVPASHRRWIGIALVPQAGVALGMALVASGKLPDLANSLMGITIATTVFFELVGPFATQLALRRVGEAK